MPADASWFDPAARLARLYNLLKMWMDIAEKTGEKDDYNTRLGCLLDTLYWIENEDARTDTEWRP